MKDFDKIYKENFSGEKEGLSPKSEDALWEAITDELGADGSIPSKTNWLGFKFLWLGGLLGGVVLVGGLFLFSLNDYHDNITIADELKHETVENASSDIAAQKKASIELTPEFTNNDRPNTIDNSLSNEANSQSISSTNTRIEVEGSTENVAPSLEKETSPFIKQDNSTTINSGISENTRTIENIDKIATNNKNSSDAQISTKNSSNNERTSSEISTRKTSIEPKRSTFINQEESKNIELAHNVENINTESKERIANDVSKSEPTMDFQSNSMVINYDHSVKTSYLPTEIILIVYSDENTTSIAATDAKLELIPVKPPVSIKERNTTFSVNVLGGINRSSVSYAGANTALVEDQNTFSQGYFGYNMGVEFQMNYKKNWTVLSGIHLENQKTKYEKVFTNTIKPNGPLLNGIVVDIDNNQVTREMFADSSFTYESLNIKRVIRSENTLKIPVLLGYETNRFGWNFGVQGGAVLHINLTNPVNSETEYAKYQMGFSLAPYVRYEFNKRLSIMARYGLSRYQQSVPGQLGLDETRYVHAMNIGVRYGL